MSAAPKRPVLLKAPAVAKGGSVGKAPAVRPPPNLAPVHVPVPKITALVPATPVTMRPPLPTPRPKALVPPAAVEPVNPRPALSIMFWGFLLARPLVWPGGFVVAPDPVPGKAGKAGFKKVPSSSTARRHNVEKYSSSYTSISLVPDSWHKVGVQLLEKLLPGHVASCSCS